MNAATIRTVNLMSVKAIWITGHGPRNQAITTRKRISQVKVDIVVLVVLVEINGA
jgi:hypothetical protein